MSEGRGEPGTLKSCHQLGFTNSQQLHTTQGERDVWQGQDLGAVHGVLACTAKQRVRGEKEWYGADSVVQQPPYEERFETPTRRPNIETNTHTVGEGGGANQGSEGHNVSSGASQQARASVQHGRGGGGSCREGKQQRRDRGQSRKGVRTGMGEGCARPSRGTYPTCRRR